MASSRLVALLVALAIVVSAPVALLHGRPLTDLSTLRSDSQRRGLAVIAPATDRGALARDVISRSLRFSYMDELFHVGQVLEYALVSNWTHWDAMITTPPGAYLPAFVGLSTSFVPVFERFGWADVESKILFVRPPLELEVVTEQYLRIVDFWAAWAVTVARASTVGTLLLVFALILNATTTTADREIRFDAMLVACSNPVLLGCGFLVYTDVPSALALVMMFLAVGASQGSSSFVRWTSVATCGAYAITVRQTNLVWLGFAAGLYGLDALRAPLSQWAPRIAVRVFHLTPVVVVAGAFAYFVVFVNGGNIVLGDASSHQPVVHPAQLALVFACAALFSPVQSLLTLLKCAAGVSRRSGSLAQKGALSLLITLCSAGCSHLLRGYVVHPYVLADNRHLTFYAHRRLLDPDLAPAMMRGAVQLLAAVGALRVLDVTGVLAFFTSPRPSSVSFASAASSRPRVVANPSPGEEDAPSIVDLLQCLWFVVCSSAACVPQKLLEFRYFVAPLIALAWGFARRRRRRLEDSSSGLARIAPWLDGAWSVAISGAMAAVFLWRPIPSQSGGALPERLMW